MLLADQLGFTEGYIGEHVTDAAENIASALIFIAWLLRETSRIRLGTGTVNLPNHHPAMVAAEVAMLDHMAKGRFIFGISPGGLPRTPRCSAISTRTAPRCSSRRSTTSSAIWRGEPPYDLEGRFWTISTARTLIPELGQGVIAKPYQQPHPPIVVTAVAPFSKGVTAAAARLGPDLGELPAAAVGQDPLAELRRGLRQGRAAGRSQELARGQEHLRRRRRGDRQALRDRSERPYHFYYSRCSPS